MAETLLKIENLKKNFGKLEVLKGISTEIRRGEVVVMTFTWLLGKLERHLRQTGADPVHNDS